MYSDPYKFRGECFRCSGAGIYVSYLLTFRSFRVIATSIKPRGTTVYLWTAVPPTPHGSMSRAIVVKASIVYAYGTWDSRLRCEPVLRGFSGHDFRFPELWLL